MSYRLRIYAPTDEGIRAVQVLDNSLRVLAEAAPQGTGQYCIDMQVSDTVQIRLSLIDGNANVSKYYVNVDGVTTEHEPDWEINQGLSMPYESYILANNVQVRVEMLITETYYATLAFDANGGTGAPSAIAGSMVNSNPYVRFVIPADVPTRSGYAFVGWNQQADGSGAKTFAPGDYFDGWGQTTSPGPTHWLYAQWTEVTSDVTAIVYDAATGTWGEYTPIVYDSGWYQYDPIFSGG